MAREGSMRVLIVDDDPVSRRGVRPLLEAWGYGVAEAADGLEALAVLTVPGGPRLALVDWTMPGLSGVELCRRLRARATGGYRYLILLTGRRSREARIEGLEAGADDFVSKPFDPEELRCRLRIGERVLALEGNLARKVAELEEALSQVKVLEGFLPICAHCKKIRDDDGYWQALEKYVTAHTGAVFSHGICDECLETYYPEVARASRSG
ncbi:MAG: hypothetical protein Kow0092_04430 [Deferrisomatales bacterium]